MNDTVRIPHPDYADDLARIVASPGGYQAIQAALRNDPRRWLKLEAKSDKYGEEVFLERHIIALTDLPPFDDLALILLDLPVGGYFHADDDCITYVRIA